MICYGQTITRSSVQEWYETSTGDARRRARELRKLYFRVSVDSSFPPQVTGVGTVKMSLLTADHADASLLPWLPSVKIERL